jgi:hypothetical protein
MAMYGERQETYTVVTGGSDGIGLAKCTIKRKIQDSPTDWISL